MRIISTLVSMINPIAKTQRIGCHLSSQRLITLIRTSLATMECIANRINLGLQMVDQVRIIMVVFRITILILIIITMRRARVCSPP